MSEFLQKGASIESEEISEEVKVKFLYCLVREYRHSVESKRQQRLKQINDEQILI